MARGILPDQGSNPSLLYWQAASLPLSHQGNPKTHSFKPNNFFLLSVDTCKIKCLTVGVITGVQSTGVQSPILYSMGHTYKWVSQVAQWSKDLPTNAGDVEDMCLIPGLGRSLGEGMATHCSIFAWRIPWTEEPSKLQSIRSQRDRHD